MEAAGLALGVVSLAGSVTGTVTSIVQCFEYVELGRHFGKDFNKSQARLGALKLQISRWGVAAGAFPDPRTGTYREVTVSVETEKEAKRLLDSILDDIEEVERKSRKYRQQHSPSSQELEVFGASDMDAPTGALSARVDTIVKKRTKGVSWRDKTKWAVYQKKYFDRLLEDIAGNFDLLANICQPLSVSQLDLCQIEVEEIEDGQPTSTLELLHEASKANHDTSLQQAVQKAIAARGCGHSWERTEVADTVKLEQGDRIAANFTGQAPVGRIGHNFGVTIGKGNAEIKQGDVYGST